MNTATNNVAALMLAGAALVLVVTYHCLTLAALPHWFVDEALTLSRVQGLLETGRADGPLDQYSLSEEGPSDNFVPNFPYWLFSAPIKLFGLDYSIPSVRLATLPAISLVLLGIGLICWRLLGPYSAALGILIAGSSTPMLWGHVARPDIIAAGFGYFALGLYRPRSRYVFWSGLLVALACAVHLRAVILVVPLGALILFDVYSKQVNWRIIFWGVVGCALGALVYLGVNLAPYWHSDAFQRGHNVVLQQSAPAALQGSLTVWWETARSLHRGLTEQYQDYWLFILIGGVICAATARTRDEQRLWLLIITSILAGLVFILGMLAMKLVIITPAVDLAMTAILYRIIAHAQFGERWRSLRRGILCATITYYIAATVIFPPPPAECEEEFSGTEQWLNQNIPHNVTVMGQEGYWMYLRDRPFVSWKLLSPYARLHGKTLDEAFDHFGADYFILDGGVLIFLKDQTFRDPFFESLRAPRTAMLSRLADYGEEIGKHSTRCYGEFALFKLRSSVNP